MSSEWGWYGSADEHTRYSQPIEEPTRKRCRQANGCTNRITHLGMANGVCLMAGCEFHVFQWVKNPNAGLDRRRAL